MSLIDKKLTYADLPIEPETITAQNGVIKFYDKEIKGDIPIETPFPFVVLEECVSLRPWDKTNKVFAKSNFIQKNELSRQILVVSEYLDNKRVEIARGFYADIKDKIVAALNSTGFTITLFVATKIRTGQEDLKMYRLDLQGSSRGEWIEHMKKPYGKIVKITGWEDRSEGATNFQVPVFETELLTDEQLDRFRTVECANLMEVLEPYIEQQQKFFRSPGEEYHEPLPSETEPEEKWGSEDEIPFQGEAATVKQAEVTAEDPF